MAETGLGADPERGKGAACGLTGLATSTPNDVLVLRTVVSSIEGCILHGCSVETRAEPRQSLTDRPPWPGLACLLADDPCSSPASRFPNTGKPEET